MIDVCVDKATLEYSRVASRLEFASIRKNIQYVLGLDDTNSFKEILQAYEDWNVWDSGVIPEYNPVWEDWYNEIKQNRLEFWQVKQWVDKYAVRVNDVVIETPHLGYLGISLTLFGDTDKARKYALALVQGKINLPTPALNGLRNGDFDTISCCVISGGDTVDSIGVANHIANKMTAKTAGIGIEFTTRSKGDSVKNGRVKHLGKHPIFKTLDREVKTMTQITRGGNATVTVLCIDPEIEDILQWKGQRVDIETRIDKLDYSFGYNDAFVEAVVKDSDWHLFSIADAPKLYDLFYTASSDVYNKEVNKLLAKGVKHKKVNAREVLKQFLTVRQETGRFYDINLTRANTHTPFEGVIRQSNLC
jgi:ribonucleoside-diphosphate reductase alpha chain